jgi:hypothetical protein
MATTYWILRGHYPGYSGTDLQWVADDGADDYQVFQERQWKSPWRTAPRVPGGDISAALRASGAVVSDLAASRYQPGEYHPRMWRPYCCPEIRKTYDVDFHSAQGAALSLFSEMKEVFRYVEPAGNRAAYGHEIRQLLILACTEVEAQCKAVLRANTYQRVTKNGKLVPEKNWNLGDFHKTARPLRLAGFKMKVRGHPTFPVLDPFDSWATATFAPLPWYSAYNKVKHDREREFPRATLENMVNAMAAVHVLIVAQFGHFGNWYHSGYSEIDAFDHTQPRPDFDLAEHYVPPELGGLPGWHTVNYAF